MAGFLNHQQYFIGNIHFIPDLLLIAPHEPMDLAHEPRHRQQLQGDTVLANSVLNALAQTQRWQQAMSFMGKEVPLVGWRCGRNGHRKWETWATATAGLM